MHNSVLAPLFYGSVIDDIFSSGRQLRQMLCFEVALAGALEDVGIAPAQTAARVEQASALFPTQAQVERIAQAAIRSGNIAIPFVQELTATVRQLYPVESDYIHFGATSQDVLDTALVLQLLEFFDLIDQSLTSACHCLVALTTAHRDVILPGRSWMQQGPPTLFGQKAAGWLSAMLRHRKRFTLARHNSIKLQFGGAVGTLASLGDEADAVSRRLSARLRLALPDLPWHTERDSLAEVATTCGLLVGTLGKIAKDLSLLMQTEVAEVREQMASGEGGSSTMPHKRNPVNAAIICLRPSPFQVL